MDNKSYEFYSSIRKLVFGDHLSSIYQYKTQAFFQVSTFFRAALSQNRKCIYVAHEYSKEEIIQALEQGGIPTRQCMGANQLVILSSKDVYLKNGTFGQQRVLAQYGEMEKQALKDGYTGINIAGEASWALKDEETTKKLMVYEEDVNHTFPHSKIMAICLYNESLFGRDILKAVLRTHPYVVIYGTLYKNTQYYAPPEAMQPTTMFSDTDYLNMVDRIISGPPETYI